MNEPGALRRFYVDYDTGNPSTSYRGVVLADEWPRALEVVGRILGYPPPAATLTVYQCDALGHEHPGTRVSIGQRVVSRHPGLAWRGQP